jgi:hypothetical protein
MTKPLIKVHDLAFLRFRAADLERRSRFCLSEIR